MTINPNYKLRMIAGECIVVNQGATHTDMTRIISLNASARMLWEALEGQSFTIDEVASLLIKRYGIEESVAQADASRWVKNLQGAGVIDD